jgi:glycerol-3-phosphate dehydrogenase
MYDIAVIGAGVSGTMIARALSRYELKTVILERDNDISTGTTKANSGIIHAGYDADANSLMGQLNAKGNAMFDQVCQDLDVPFERVGSLVVAHNQDEIKTLNALLENGRKLNIPGLEIVDQTRVRSIEPHLKEDIVAALYAPTAGIIEPWELAIASAENAIENGCELKLNFSVKAIEEHDDGFTIKSGNEIVKARYVINAAGVYADKIYGMVTEPEFSITPRRGQYFLLDKEADGLVKHVVFPCPTKMGKGTLLTPTVDRNIIIGPDSQNLSRDEKEATETTMDRLNLVKDMATHLIDEIPYRLNITTFAGLRAEPSTGDFIIEESPKVKHFINVAGIKSPGLSSAPAIAEYVLDIIKELEGSLIEKVSYDPTRRPRIKFEELTNDERQMMIEKDPRYGRIICRCEMITEGEIVDAIHRAAGGRTLNGIKRRVRPGAGRCQGGFCGPRVMEILARELKEDITEILQENKGSSVLIGETKEV